MARYIPEEGSGGGGAPTGPAGGDLTGTYPDPTIASDAVTYAKMQNVSATDNVLGRSTAGSGDVEEISCTAAGRALIAGTNAAAQRATLAILATSSGTFTPTVTLVGGVGNTVPVYTTNLGYYVRVGDWVWCEIWLTGDGGAEGAGSGALTIALPFTSAADGGQSFRGRGTQVFGYLGAAGAALSCAFQLLSSEAVITMYRITGFNAASVMTGADQNNTVRGISVLVVYRAVA